MKALPLCCGVLLASLQLPKATNSWSPSTWGTTISLRTSPRTPPALTVSLATKDSEAEVPRKTEKKTNKGETEKLFDIRNYCYYDRFASFLESEIGLTNQSYVKRIAERSPSLLSYTEPRLNETFNLFRDLFGYSNKELEKVLRKEPKIFVLSVQCLKTKLMNVSHHLFEGDMSSASVVLAKQPAVLGLDLETNLLPKVKYLRDEVFQGDNEATQECLLRCPRILTLSLNSRIIPRAQALLTQGLDPSRKVPTWSGLTEKKFEKWFVKGTGVPLPDGWCPPKNGNKEWLTFEQRVQERLKLLSTELSLDREEALSLIERAPLIKQRSVDYLKKKLEYLVVLFCSKEEAKEVVLKRPMLLTHSLETSLKPKVAYLRQAVFYGNDQYLIPMLKAYPSIFSQSLEKRLKPRIEATIAAGLNPSDLNVGLMVRKSDKEFPQWLKRQQQESLHD